MCVTIINIRQVLNHMLGTTLSSVRIRSFDEHDTLTRWALLLALLYGRPWVGAEAGWSKTHYQGHQVPWKMFSP